MAEQFDHPTDHGGEPTGVQTLSGLVVGAAIGALIWTIIVLGVSALIELFR